MDITIKIEPFERLQNIYVKKDNGETERHFCFLEDIPNEILNSYKQKDSNETCVIRLLGNNSFNQGYKQKINECFIKEYGSSDYIIIM